MYLLTLIKFGRRLLNTWLFNYTYQFFRPRPTRLHTYQPALDLLLPLKLPTHLRYLLRQVMSYCRLLSRIPNKVIPIKTSTGSLMLYSSTTIAIGTAVPYLPAGSCAT